MSQAFQVHSLAAPAAAADRQLGLWRRLALMVQTKLQAARGRRAIAALGPHGRRELHALLIASSGRGIPETVWSGRDWEEDAERF
jgi:hypothetical protein